MKPKKICRYLLQIGVVSGAHVWTGSAYGQDTPVPAGKVEKVSAVVHVVGTQEAYDARKEETTTKTVIGSAELNKYGDPSVVEVLKRQPGVTVIGGGGRGGGDVRLKGLGNGYTQILLNGQPAPAGFTLDSLAPSQVDRIEIMRVATAEFSTQAMAGTINVYTKTRPTSQPADLRVLAESNSGYRMVNPTYQGGGKRDAFSYSLGANVRAGRMRPDQHLNEATWDSADRLLESRTGDASQRGYFSLLSLTPRLTWTPRDSDSWTLNSLLTSGAIYDMETRTQWQTLAGPIRQPERVENSPIDNFVIGRTELVWARREDGRRAEIRGGFSSTRAHTRHDESGMTSAGQLLFNRLMDSRVREENFNLAGKFFRNKTVLGDIAFGWEANQNRREETDVNSSVPADIHASANGDYAACVAKGAVFAQLERQYSPTLSAYFGLRNEHMRTTAKALASQHASSSNVLSPILQVLKKLSEKKGQVRFAVSRTFRAPPLRKMVPVRYFSTSNSMTDPDSLGTIQLEPEVADGIDLGYEQSVSGASFGVSGYVRRVNNLIMDQLRFIDGRWVSSPTNNGSADTAGIDIDTKFPLSMFLAQAKGIDVRMNLSRNLSRVKEVPGPNNYLANQVPLSALLGVDYQNGKGISAGAKFSFRRAGTYRLSAEHTQYSTHRRDLEAYVMKQVTKTVRLRATVTNLTGQDSYSSSYINQPGQRYFGSKQVPAGLGLRLSLETKI